MEAGNQGEIELGVNICIGAVIAVLPRCEALAITPGQIAKLLPYGFHADDVKSILSVAMEESNGAIQKTKGNRYFVGNVIYT